MALRSIIALWLIGIVFGITSGYVLMHYHFNWPLFSAERLLMTTIICNIVFTIILWGSLISDLRRATLSTASSDFIPTSCLFIWISRSKTTISRLPTKIMDDIVAGIYPEGQRIPSVREYASSVEVNANTVMRTYDFLSQRELIFNRRGIGFFSSKQKPAKRFWQCARKLSFASEATYFMQRLYSFGVSPDELREMYISFINEYSKS